MIFPILVLMTTSCKKFLEIKPDERLVIVTSVQDMQALLDNYNKMNYNDQAVSQVCSDDYYLTDATLNARKETDRNLYNWAASNIFDPNFNAWADTYGAVYIANLVLERSGALGDKISDKAALNNVRAQAFFHRGRQFLHAANVWTKDFDPETAARELGIPLLTTPDFNIASVRSSLAETYAQIISDLKQSATGLPPLASTPFRPSKAAAFALLARTYLYHKDYPNAERYADSCLAIKSTLIDYNTLNASANFPISRLNNEIIFESKMVPVSQILQSRAYINPKLYQLYPSTDLRKTIFFRPGTLDMVFKGNYAGDDTFFNGIATDEVLLIRAEAAARNGRLNIAINDLNLLRKNRISSASYVGIVPVTTIEALNLIKNERRLELPFRGFRWMDIKRWNTEGDNIILTRANNGNNYTLPPNDLRFALAIPEDVIQRSGMQQNPR